MLLCMNKYRENESLSALFFSPCSGRYSLARLTTQPATRTKLSVRHATCNAKNGGKWEHKSTLECETHRNQAEHFGASLAAARAGAVGINSGRRLVVQRQNTARHCGKLQAAAKPGSIRPKTSANLQSRNPCLIAAFAYFHFLEKRCANTCHEPCAHTCARRAAAHFGRNLGRCTLQTTVPRNFLGLHCGWSSKL